MTDRELVDLAIRASEQAYAPYSGFHVGAALECADGTVYTGCNIENASYGGAICAERTAICKAVSEGRRTFRRIAVYGPSAGWCMPCGICRQFMAEFGTELQVICARKDGAFKSWTLRELLPEAFEL